MLLRKFEELLHYHIDNTLSLDNHRDFERIQKVKVKLKLPLVLKADGLAAGKGVIVCATESEYEAGLTTMFDENAFGDAGEKVSVEDCLIGEELSVFVVCDGKDYVILNKFN